MCHSRINQIATVIALTLIHLIVTIMVVLTAMPIAFSTGPEASPADIAAAEAWAKAVEVMTFPVYPYAFDWQMSQFLHDALLALNSLLWGIIIFLMIKLLSRVIRSSKLPDK